MTSFTDTLPDTTGDETGMVTGVSTIDPDSTGVGTVGMDSDTGATEGLTTDASTTDPSATDGMTTDVTTTDAMTTTDGGGECGNGMVEGAEECDVEDLDGQDCASQGFMGGALGCNADCTFDTSNCTNRSCGNGAVEGMEQCDGADLDGATCVTEGFDGGALGCADDCTYDTTGCMNAPACGNGAIDAMEQCDGANLAGQTCVTQGFDGGALGCAGDCTYDTSGCTIAPTCGNGALDPMEACDGANLNGQTCVSQGFAGGGVLACAADCGGFDTAGCIGGGAGDCCIANGTPGCDDAVCEAAICGADAFCCDTQWDQICADAAVASCAVCGGGGAVCGDGAIGGAEVCDGANLNGQTCVSQGFAGGGVLACAGDCSGFNTAGCIGGGAGDCCIANGTPGCDDAVCEAAICGADAFCCDTQWDQICADAAVASCAVCGGGGAVCGDGAIGGAESCDGANLNGQTCVSLGFAGGGVLACAGDCSYNTAGCIGGGAGDCCIANGTPGCDDAVCEAAICGADAFCCDTQWDQICADAAVASCAVCGGGGAVCGDGAIGGAEVCDGANLNGQTCVSQGFAGGGVLACAGDCAGFNTAGCIGGGAGDCCIANGTPGCDDAVCEAAICGADAFCCDTQWDQICADAAVASCAVCGGGGAVCGDGAVSGAEVCDGANLNGQTCVTQGFAGGGVLGCQAGCGAFDTAGCIGGGAGDCCIANGTPGCDDAVCEAAICGADAFCCDTQWDQICADAAVASCAVCGGGGGVFACEDQNIGSAIGAAVASGNTAGSDNDLNPSCGAGDALDHVMRFTAPAAGQYTFNTSGSAFDTVMSLFSDCATQLACNDDSIGLQSQLVRNMAAGEVVLILVDGYNGATGAWTLNITSP